MIVFLAFGLWGPAVQVEETTGWLGGVETWGGRPALPALVNPVVSWPLQSLLRLRGEWEFVTRETAPLRHPGWNAFYARPWPEARAIRVPGCWEAQGVGTPGMGDSWDCKWDHCAKPLRWVYKGDAWYRKAVAIPEAWRGQRIWLKVGGVRAQGWFWVNQTPVAWVDNYCGTYKYDITDLVQAGAQAVVVAEGMVEGGDVELGSVRSLGQADFVISELQRPLHAVLQVSLAGGPLRNQWDFWLFPKRVPQRVAGVAVSKPLLSELAPLYSGLLATGDPGAEQVGVLISFLGSADVEPALASGQRVILLDRTTGKPNVSLGWWSMGEQVGTAFARHPALGDFPHEGYLSPLAFRILKTGRKPPSLAGLRPDDMFIVGEGLDNYFLYAGQARIKRGRALMTFGLDLLSGHPEGTCLLDGLIRYAQSNVFNPRGEVALPAMSCVRR